MKSTIAATALAIVTAVLGLGMLVGPGQAQAHCPMDEPCPAVEEASPVAVGALLDEWETSLNVVMYRMDERFRRLAGAPTFR